MRFLPVHAEKRVSPLLRFDLRMVRRMPAVLLLIAAGLTAWMLELGAVLHGQAQVRNWSSVWVGLDLMEIAGLVLTAVLLRRRSAYLAAVAAVTATLFAVDAWFDLLTAAAGADWYESVAAALFGEVPMTGLLAAVAIWASRQGSASCLRGRLRSRTVASRSPLHALQDSPGGGLDVDLVRPVVHAAFTGVPVHAG